MRVPVEQSPDPVAQMRHDRLLSALRRLRSIQSEVNILRCVVPPDVELDGVPGPEQMAHLRAELEGWCDQVSEELRRG